MAALKSLQWRSFLKAIVVLLLSSRLAARKLDGAGSCGPGEAWDSVQKACRLAGPGRPGELPPVEPVTPTPAPTGPVACERYYILKAGDDLASIAATFRTNVAGLRELNPRLGEVAELLTPGEGAPLCVVGTVLSGTARASGDAAAGGQQQPSSRGKRIGRRPASTVTFVTTPGAHTCSDIITKAQPPLDIMTFVAMNPTLDCSKLPDQATTVYLPKGTKIGGKKAAGVVRGAAAAAAVRKDCIVGPWGDWGECSTGGTQLRFRTTYQEPSGGGDACPPTSETRSCDPAAAEDHNNATSTSHGPTRRMALAPNECPLGYDGCSVPSWAPYYHLFVPACNLHDICYSCNAHPGWSFASKWYCDYNVFYAKMTGQCSAYWTKWSQALDRAYCNVMASAYLGAVLYASNPDNWENPPNANVKADGCYWKPWEAPVNNVNGGGFHPAWAGCTCFGTSCQYWQ